MYSSNSLGSAFDDQKDWNKISVSCPLLYPLCKVNRKKKKKKKNIPYKGLKTMNILMY